ncbi:MAG: helix-turn-helix transcriptional regulator [Anaerotignum sp.]|nr:helix-turn-helix transcriptional regulator [Anaerotignum sp.]MDY3926808.1 helix-turn-helix transcriptional regulator [Anaerotignum sp.]
MVENKVRERRKELGMTLEQLSHESGVSTSTLSDVERGIEPKVKTAQRIAHALGRSVDDLWPES